MAMELTPTTELEAVNEMLTTIGETPVETLDNLGFTDAAIARDVLRAVSREVQTVGWFFNTDEAYVFQPDLDGNVALPANLLKVRAGGDEERVLIQRGGKLYDRTNATFTFAADTPPTCFVVWFLDYETLPETARRLIAIRAARIFQTKVLGSDQLHVFTEDHEREARSALNVEESENNPSNFLTDSADVSEIWQR